MTRLLRDGRPPPQRGGRRRIPPDAEGQGVPQLMIARGGRFEDLPAGSFAAVGTNVNTIVVTVGGSAHSGRRFEP